MLKEFKYNLSTNESGSLSELAIEDKIDEKIEKHLQKHRKYVDRAIA